MSDQKSQGSQDSFTPGPWREHAPDIADVGVTENYRYIQGGAECESFGSSPPQWGSEHFCVSGYITPANARLIAAAPDLLNGCRALLGLIQLISSRDDIAS